MGFLKLIKKFKAKEKEIRVLTLGLDNSGKTTIIKKILNKNVDNISPSMGFEINTYIYNDKSINIWDIGGQLSLRNFWLNYIDKTDVLLWVVDSTNMDRLNESCTELWNKVIFQESFFEIKLILVFNKIDLWDKKDHENLNVKKTEFENFFKLHNLKQNLHYEILFVSGITGEGLIPLLQSIVQKVF